MADPHFPSPPDSKQSTAGAQECPAVADLIHYALGTAPAEERRHIEAHLQKKDCCLCRSWIDKAIQFRQEPMPAKRSLDAPVDAYFFTSLPSSSSPTPIPDNPKWRQQALRDLQTRLQNLEQDQQTT